MKKVQIADDWYSLLEEEFDKQYFKDLVSFVKQEYRNYTIYPKGSDIFRAFDACQFEKLQVVIIGQDPYHGDRQANGLSFSVNPSAPYPPSLRNIFQEVASCGYTQVPENGDLGRWAEQGVLLLNAVLTVRANTPTSHAGKGWELFTDAVIRKISERKQNVVYMLWGSYAQQKASHVNASDNLILKSPHPSPLSAYRGFFGSAHFRKANEYFRQHNMNEIKW